MIAANDRQFQRLCAALGIPEVAEDERFLHNGDRTTQPRRSSRPLLEEQLAKRKAARVVRPAARRRACRAGRSTPSTTGSPPPSGSGSSRSSRSARATAPCPTTRHPIRFSGTPVELRAAAAGAGRARRRAAGLAATAESDDRAADATRPRWAPPAARRITLLGQDLARDVMGSVGFGELAFWLATQRRPEPGRGAGLRGGARRAGRPRLHADRDRDPADLAVRARLGAGRAGRRAARRRLAVPRGHRGLRPVPARRDRRARRAADRRPRLGRGRPRRRTPPARGRRASCPASATTCTRTATRARRGCSRSPARRASSVRTSRCSRRSAGCTPRCSGKTLPLNGAGVCGAALADLDLPLELLRGFALLARTAGLIGQLAEELRHPVANDIFLSVDLNNRPVDPDPLPRRTPR